MASKIANHYYSGMRGDALKEVRRQNLMLLKRELSFEEIAAKTNTNASYLSQIANKTIQKKGKKPRALSDDYAEQIEVGLGLPVEWMDRQHEEGQPSAINLRNDIDMLTEEQRVVVALMQRMPENRIATLLDVARSFATEESYLLKKLHGTV